MKPRKGLMPVPAAMQMTGVVSGVWGRWKAAWDGRTATWSLSPGSRELRYEEATPTCVPCPDFEGASRTAKVNVTWVEFHKGEEEMELGNACQ